MNSPVVSDDLLEICFLFPSTRSARTGTDGSVVCVPRPSRARPRVKVVGVDTLRPGQGSWDWSQSTVGRRSYQWYTIPSLLSPCECGRQTGRQVTETAGGRAGRGGAPGVREYFRGDWSPE